MFATCLAHGSSISSLHTPVSLHSDDGHMWTAETNTYAVDGLRVDTVKHVEGAFWTIFNSASGVYNVGEVADGDVPYVCPYQNYMDGVLAYPTFVPTPDHEY